MSLDFNDEPRNAGNTQQSNDHKGAGCNANIDCTIDRPPARFLTSAALLTPASEYVKRADRQSGLGNKSVIPRHVEIKMPFKIRGVSDDHRQMA
jgi:hypothetical protein